MKKLFILAALFLLIGAGCTQNLDQPFGESAIFDRIEDGVSDESDAVNEEGGNKADETEAAEDENETTSQMPADSDSDVDETFVNENGDMIDGPAEEGVVAEETDQMQDPQQGEQQDQREEQTQSAIHTNMLSGNFFFTPDVLRVNPGDSVSITFTENAGFHTFVIDEIGFKETVVEGGTITFTAPSEPGSYAYYCDVGSHRALGMEGVLIVE